MALSDFIAEQTNDYVRDLARIGKSAKRISQDLRERYLVNLTSSQVQMILANTTESQIPQPGAASLDGIVTAHEWLHRVMRGINAACALTKRNAEASGKDDLEIVVAITATEAASDTRVALAIMGVQRAEKSYVDSGGTRSDIDRVLNLHFHASDAGTAPTPTPGVVDV